MTLDRALWRIWPELPRATISPNIYGHFAEHLGRCIYEGIWVGPESMIPNEDGFRLDTLRALRELPTPVLRWPGGCFADDYHWEDGVGPREHRPRRRNLWWHGEDSNHFGTDEFVEFCRRIGAQPYICANVGSGTPAEAANWVEYCNGTASTHYVQFRRANGHVEPHGVRYWGVGNENWGCGGNFTPEEYAAAYRRFATYMKGRSDEIELIAVGDHAEGHQGPDWNRRFLDALGVEQNPRLLRLIDHLSVHRYFRPGNDVAYTDEEYYEFLQRALVVEEDLRRARDLLSYYSQCAGGQKRIGLVVDEWGTWYYQARNDTGLEQRSTLLDAVVAGGTLNLFNRWADWVTMANIAQTVNVLQAVIQTAEEKLWLTPTYHVYRLYAAHMGQRVLTDELETPEREVRQADGKPGSLPLVSASASRSADGRELVLTLVNRHLTDAVECAVQIEGEARAWAGTLDRLADEDVRAFNSASEPGRVRPEARPCSASGGEFAVVLPAHSVSALRLAGS